MPRFVLVKTPIGIYPTGVHRFVDLAEAEGLVSMGGVAVAPHDVDGYLAAFGDGKVIEHAAKAILATPMGERVVELTPVPVSGVAISLPGIAGAGSIALKPMA
jgi:hypothetical protein